MADKLVGIDVMEDEVVSRQTEIGGTGVMLIQGDVFNMEDYVPELRGESAMRKYEEMWYSDPGIDGALYHLRAPIVSGTWITEPAKSSTGPDGQPAPSDKDKEVADFVRQWTIDSDPLDDGTGWAGFVDHTLSMMTVFGHLVAEKVWGITKKGGYQVIEKYAPRDPKSIQLFHVGRDRRLEYVEQYAYGPDGWDTFRIPSARIVPFTLRKRGDNWWGRPLVRSCYMPWSIWRQLAIIDAMRHERHGMGIPVLEIPPSAGSKAIEQAKKVVKELRAHERQYVTLPPGFKLTWYFPTGSGTDIIRSMEYWDGRKARALLNEISTYGSGNVGGNRSLGQTVEQAMRLGVQGLAMQFASTMKKYAVGPMVRRNFGDDVGVPELKIEDLDALDILGLAKALKELRDGDFIGPDEPLEVFLRSKLHVTARDPDTTREKQIMAALPMGDDPGEPGASDQPGTTPPSKRARETSIRIIKRRVTGSARYRSMGLSRAPMDHERWCDFNGIVEFFDANSGDESDAYKRIAKIREKQIYDVAASVSTADVKDLSKKRVKYPRIGTMAETAFDLMRDAYTYGRRTIKDERARQLRGDEPSRPDTDAPIVGALSDLLEPTTKEIARVKRLAESFAEDMTEDVVQRAVDVGLRAKLLGLAESEVEFRIIEALKELSDAVAAAKLQGDMVASFTIGRNDAMGRVETEISATFYSAIMDEGTCGPCAALDGQEHEFGDTRYMTPNPNCAWPPYCRCVTIPVFLRPEEMTALTGGNTNG